MYNATWVGWEAMQAGRAFDRAVRARRRARLGGCTGRLDVHAPDHPAVPAVREIPLDAIVGTLEPHRAGDFDCVFRPVARARRRWLSVWLAETKGAGLPPISVKRVAGGYAVGDGHHRVSVARARGADTITAIVG